MDGPFENVGIFVITNKSGSDGESLSHVGEAQNQTAMGMSEHFRGVVHIRFLPPIEKERGIFRHNFLLLKFIPQ